MQRNSGSKKYTVTKVRTGEQQQLSWGDLSEDFANQGCLEDEKKESGDSDDATETLRGVGQTVTALSAGLEKNQVLLAEERQGRAVKRYSVCIPLCFLVLSLRLELFPEGPLQLRDGQSEGEGAVRL